MTTLHVLVIPRAGKDVAAVGRVEISGREGVAGGACRGTTGHCGEVGVGEVQPVGLCAVVGTGQIHHCALRSGGPSPEGAHILQAVVAVEAGSEVTVGILADVVLPVYLFQQPLLGVCTALDIEVRGTLCTGYGVHDLFQQVGKVLNAGLLIVDVGALGHGQDALNRELPLLWVAVEDRAEVLCLHEALPDHGAIGRECHGAACVRSWYQVLPVEGAAVGILAVVDDAEVARLCTDGAEHILVVALLGGERLRSAHQGDGGASAAANVHDVGGSGPEALELYGIVFCHFVLLHIQRNSVVGLPKEGYSE